MRKIDSEIDLKERLFIFEKKIQRDKERQKGRETERDRETETEMY